MTDKSWRSKALKIVGGVVKSPTNTVIYWWQSLVDVTELRRRTGQEHKVRCAMTWWCPSAQRETGSWWVVGSARCEGLGTLQGRWTSWTVDQARRRMPVLKVTISVGSAWRRLTDHCHNEPCRQVNWSNTVTHCCQVSSCQRPQRFELRRCSITTTADCDDRNYRH